MSHVTAICCSCGGLFITDNDDHHPLSHGAQPADEFYICDECLAKERLDDIQAPAAS